MPKILYLIVYGCSPIITKRSFCWQNHQQQLKRSTFSVFSHAQRTKLELSPVCRCTTHQQTNRLVKDSLLPFNIHEIII